jgi:hypothetical protein
LTQRPAGAVVVCSFRSKGWLRAATSHPPPKGGIAVVGREEALFVGHAAVRYYARNERCCSTEREEPRALGPANSLSGHAIARQSEARLLRSSPSEHSKKAEQTGGHRGCNFSERRAVRIRLQGRKCAPSAS